MNTLEKIATTAFIVLASAAADSYIRLSSDYAWCRQQERSYVLNTVPDSLLNSVKKLKAPNTGETCAQIYDHLDELTYTSF